MSPLTKPRFVLVTLILQLLRGQLDSDAAFSLQAIHKLTDYLSYQVRLVARELVDAFDLPDLIIRAPIGMQSEAYAQYTQHVGF
jgi:acyl-CoA oxidase